MPDRHKVVSAPPPALAQHEPPIDVVHDYPDVVSEGLSEPPPLLVEPDDETEEQTALFDVPRGRGRVRAAGPRRAQGLAAGGVERERAPTSAPPTRS